MVDGSGEDTGVVCSDSVTVAEDWVESVTTSSLVVDSSDSLVIVCSVDWTVVCFVMSELPVSLQIYKVWRC